MSISILKNGPPLNFLNLSNCGAETGEGEEILDALCSRGITTIKFLLINDNDAWWAREESIEKLDEFISR